MSPKKKRAKKMDEADPIETDDPLEASIWHAEDKMRALRAEMSGLQARLKQCRHMLDQWQAHHTAVSAARATRARLVEQNESEAEEPTQRTNPLKRIRDD